LFQTKLGRRNADHFAYDVTADGQKFLMVAQPAVGKTTPRP